MKKSIVVVSLIVPLLFLVPLFNGGIGTAIAARNQDASESWGYVEVRPSKL